MDAGDIHSFIEQDLPYFFPLLFVFIWLIMVKIISIVSGWKKLAETYPVHTPFSGEKHMFKSGRMKRGMNFNNCLTVGANHVGLYLSMFIIFRIGHDPIFIPWSEIRVSVEEGRFTNYVKLSFSRCPENWLKISRKLYQKLERDSGVQSLTETI